MFSFKKKLAPAQKNLNDVLVNPKILDVNLIKDEVEVVFDWRRGLMALGIVLVLAAGLLVEVYFGLDWWEKVEAAKAEEINQKIEVINKDINALKVKSDEAQSFKNRAAAVNDLLSGHVYWTNFFSWLEKNTLSSVKYSSFSGKTDGKYSFSATAATFADASWQAKILSESPMVEKVLIDSVSAGADGAAGQTSFTITLEVNPEIFKK